MQTKNAAVIKYLSCTNFDWGLEDLSLIQAVTTKENKDTLNLMLGTDRDLNRDSEVVRV